jgi:hypothetical protein
VIVTALSKQSEIISKSANCRRCGRDGNATVFACYFALCSVFEFKIKAELAVAASGIYEPPKLFFFGGRCFVFDTSECRCNKITEFNHSGYTLFAGVRLQWGEHIITDPNHYTCRLYLTDSLKCPRSYSVVVRECSGFFRKVNFHSFEQVCGQHSRHLTVEYAGGIELVITNTLNNTQAGHFAYVDVISILEAPTFTYRSACICLIDGYS